MEETNGPDWPPSPLPGVMSLSHVVDTVLRCAPPYGTPGHRAPPQLCYIHVITGDISAQILLNVLATACGANVRDPPDNVS